MRPTPLLRIAAGLLAATASAVVLAQQAFPSRAIRIIVPYPPGASTDALSRTLAVKLSESMGQPVIVENKAGASGNIGADFVAKAAPDGYTILMGTDATHGTSPHITKDLPFHPVRDFTAITVAVGNIIGLAAHPSTPFNTVAELVEHAKKNPGKLSFASSGNGSPHHLAGEMLNQMAGISLVHVPYKGGGVAITDLLGGQIPLMFSSLAAVVQHARSGKVKMLGVIESTRFPGMPDLPTIGETVKGFELASWLAYFGPANMPQAVTEKLSAELAKALNLPDVRAKLEPAGMVILGLPPAKSAEVVKAEVERRGRLIRAAGIQPG